MVEETIDHTTLRRINELGEAECELVFPPEAEDVSQPFPQEAEEIVQPVVAEECVEDENSEESLEERLKSLHASLEQSKADASKNRTDYLRALADMDNLRKRTARDKENTRKFAIERFAADLVEVMDNVSRAIETLDAGVEVGQENGASIQSVIQGVQMIQSEFEKTFSKNGITRIKSVSEPFDPNFHQAVQQVEAEDCQPGTVVQEMRAGYLLNDRLLRPAMVAVSQ